MLKEKEHRNINIPPQTPPLPPIPNIPIVQSQTTKTPIEEWLKKLEKELLNNYEDDLLFYLKWPLTNIIISKERVLNL